MTAARWTSLDGQAALARRLFADGPQRLDRWLGAQVARIDDPAFARRFHDHIALPGIAASDYAHRHIVTARGALLGGIRFFGGDPTRPFVDVLAHSFAPRDIAALVDTVATEWAGFGPLHLRVLETPADWARIARLHPQATIDMSVHAARHADMTPPDGRVTLTGFDAAEQAIALVGDRYAAMAQVKPELARNLSPAGPDDLRDWHARGQLRAIRAKAQAVGLLALAPGAIAWIDGDEVQEEVVATAFSGRGYAASAQAAWAAGAQDPTALFIGTINHMNPASRRSAERAGRPAVLLYGFVPTAPVSFPSGQAR